MTGLPKLRLPVSRIAPLLFLSLAVGASPANGFIGGMVAYERDTPVFYYPLFTWAAQQLHAGHFPLWLPEILGGYPLFADGEIGLAAPQVLLALVTLPTDVAFVVLRLLHALVAALGAYALARAWRLPRAPATLVGLTFTLGSFLQAHVHHENIVRTAAWLPLALACLERALRSRDRHCLRWLAAAGLSLGLAGLGLHPQILVAELLALAAYGVLRTWAGPSPCAGLLRPLRTFGFVLTVVGLGLAIALVQLIPLAELAVLSARAGSFPYTEVAGQSLTPYGFTQLILPFVFRDAQLRQWGLWTHWESYLYLGLAPLMLVLVALLRVRRRRVMLWLVLAAAGLALALGQYLPVDSFALLRSLPGLGWLRAPGRFSVITDLALAMLAGHGLLALQAHARLRNPTRGSWRIVLGLLVVPAGVAVSIQVLRAQIGAAPEAVQQLIEQHYLSLPHDSRWMSASDVYAGLLWSFNFENPRTAGAVVSLALISVVLGVWQAGAWIRARRWRGWPAVLVASAAVDLLVFGWSIHPRESLSTIAAQHPAALAVRKLVDGIGGTQAPVRVLASPVLNQVVSDRLAPLGLQEVGGYSSLEPSRHRAYLRRMRQVDDDLLDLWNVRYILDPADYGQLASYNGVHYAPGNFLLRAATRRGVGEETFRVPTDFRVAEIRVISGLAGAADVAQGQAVAAFVLRSQSGQIVAEDFLRAGQHVMDWGWNATALSGNGHMRVEVAGDVQELLPDGATAQRQLSFGQLVLAHPTTATTLEIQALTPHGEIVIQAAALLDEDGRVHQLMGRTQKSKYREVFRDDGIVLLENSAAFPRAYLVQQYRIALPNASLEFMERQPFLPRDEVVLAADTPPREQAAAAVRGGRGALPMPGQAIIRQYEPQQVTIDVSTAQASFLVLSDAFYPGWHAYIDGFEQPILRGNFLFRVVQVPDGGHEVVFRSQPTTVLVGLAVSASALVLTIALLVLGTTGVHSPGPATGFSAPDAACVGSRRATGQ